MFVVQPALDFPHGSDQKTPHLAPTIDLCKTGLARRHQRKPPLTAVMPGLLVVVVLLQDLFTLVSGSEPNPLGSKRQSDRAFLSEKQHPQSVSQLSVRGIPSLVLLFLEVECI